MLIQAKALYNLAKNDAVGSIVTIGKYTKQVITHSYDQSKFPYQCGTVDAGNYGFVHEDVMIEITEPSKRLRRFLQ